MHKHHPLFFLLVGKYIPFLIDDFLKLSDVALFLHHLPAGFLSKMLGLLDLIHVLLDHNLLVVPCFFQHILIITLIKLERSKSFRCLRNE